VVELVRDLRLWDYLTGVILVAIIYSLVRPGSQASAAVGDVSTALIALVGAATGYQATTGATAGGGTTNPQA
jgi:hypothetical protein